MEKIKQEFQMIEDQSLQAKKVKLPKKGDFRQRAHKNIFARTGFAYPQNPNYVDWKLFYPKIFGGTDEENYKIYINTAEFPVEFKQKVDDKFNGKNGRSPDFIDVGCGYGGLLFSLSEQFPDKISFGIEIRDKVTQYVGQKISGMRKQHPGKYNNISVIKNNAQRHLTNFFRKDSIEKLFFLFADPCFKKKYHRRRIINYHFLSEYAYLLKPKGRIYCITDVADLFNWEVEHLEAHPEFKRVSEEELKDDPCIKFMHYSTEESMKVDREKRTESKQYCVYEKIIVEAPLVKPPTNKRREKKEEEKKIDYGDESESGDEGEMEEEEQEEEAEEKEEEENEEEEQKEQIDEEEREEEQIDEEEREEEQIDEEEDKEAKDEKDENTMKEEQSENKENSENENQQLDKKSSENEKSDNEKKSEKEKQSNKE